MTRETIIVVATVIGCSLVVAFALAVSIIATLLEWS